MDNTAKNVKPISSDNIPTGTFFIGEIDGARGLYLKTGWRVVIISRDVFAGTGVCFSNDVVNIINYEPVDVTITIDHKG